MTSNIGKVIGRHVVIAEEGRSCELHGAYSALLWSLDGKRAQNGDRATPTFLAPFWGNCPICDGEWQREADERDNAIRSGKTRQQQLAAMRVASAGIPPRHANSTIWNWQHGPDKQRKVWSWAHDFAVQFELAIETGRCGVFTGTTGAGKTHLACGLLRHVVEKGGTGLYCTVMDMLDRIKATFGERPHETMAQVLDVLCGVDLLVLDEVGNSLGTNYETAQFFRVIDRRYEHLKPTILVSNLGVDDLKKFLGTAVVDRMREGGGAMLVFDWGSMRSMRRKEES